MYTQNDIHEEMYVRENNIHTYLVYSVNALLVYLHSPYIHLVNSGNECYIIILIVL